MPTRRLNSESNDRFNQHRNVRTESSSDEEPNRSGQGNSRRRHRSRSLLVRRLPFRHKVEPCLNRLEFIAEAVESQLTEDMEKLRVSKEDDEGRPPSPSNVERTMPVINNTTEEIRAVSNGQAEPMDIDSCSSMSFDEPIIPERKRQLETTKSFVEHKILQVGSILASVEQDVARARNLLRIKKRQSKALFNYRRRINLARMRKRRWPGNAEE
ncbi:hypothetical protein ACOME3_008125 [Neoechinorhynchus agilis]